MAYRNVSCLIPGISLHTALCLSFLCAGFLWLQSPPPAHALEPATATPATLYVANEGQEDGTGSSVSVIDASSLTLTATIDLGKSGPIYPIVSPDGKTLWVTHYVTNYNNGKCERSGVTVVSLATMKIETKIALPQCPNTLVFSADGKFAYTMSVVGPVSVIDTAKRSVVASITVSTGQYDLALSHDGSKLYAADAGDANLSVIDTASNTVVSQIAMQSAPFAIVLTPNGNDAFVSTVSNTATFEEVDLTAGKVVATIPPAVSSETNGLAISPNGKLLYDVDYDAQTVWLYNLPTLSQTGSITNFSYPIGLALGPRNAFAYVTNNNCAAFPCPNPGYVTVLSTKTHAVIGTVNAGINPQFITVFPRP